MQLVIIIYNNNRKLLTDWDYDFGEHVFKIVFEIHLQVSVFKLMQSSFTVHVFVFVFEVFSSICICI